MGIIKSVISKHEEKIKRRNELCDNLIIQINKALKEISILFSDPSSFIDPNKEKEWKDKHTVLLLNTNPANIQKLKKAANYSKLLSKQTELYRNSADFRMHINVHNGKTADKKLQEAYVFLGDVEGRRLDKQQMICVIKDTHNQLVIAGAGTGKTTTIIGKIKYLLKTEKYKPEDFLVLSFTNASASEMKQKNYK